MGRQPVTTVKLRTPYLVMLGAEDDPAGAKTGRGIVHWRRDRVAGQLRFAGCRADLGVPDLTIEEAAAAGVGSLIIGVAPVGGRIPEAWWPVINQAARAGLDIVSGLHERLSAVPELVNTATAAGGRVVDVREPPQNLPVGTGIRRSGRRLLTVGTDCAVGKMYTALALDQAMRAAGLDSTFRATGQTGIMIAGAGIPIDAVVADFIAGAAELLSPASEAGHWDVIEGQGSLFHPGFSGVSLGLLHGSQPDAIVVCHDAARTRVSHFEHMALPSIAECIALHLAAGQRTNPGIRCVGVSINTSRLNAQDRAACLEEISAATGLPCVDPLIDGCGAIVEFINNQRWD